MELDVFVRVPREAFPHQRNLTSAVGMMIPQDEGVWENTCKLRVTGRVEQLTDAVCFELCLPLKMLLATAPQGAIGRPLGSFKNGSQYELGY